MKRVLHHWSERWAGHCHALCLFIDGLSNELQSLTISSVFQLQANGYMPIGLWRRSLGAQEFHHERGCCCYISYIHQMDWNNPPCLLPTQHQDYMFKSSTTLMRSKVLMTHVTTPTALGEWKGTAAYQIPCVCVWLSLHRKDREAVEGLRCCMEATLWYKGKPAPMMPFLDTCGTQATTSSGPQHRRKELYCRTRVKETLYIRSSARTLSLAWIWTHAGQHKLWHVMMSLQVTVWHVEVRI